MTFLYREFKITHLPQHLDRKLPQAGFPGVVLTDASEASVRLAHEPDVEQKNGDLCMWTHLEYHTSSMEKVYEGKKAYNNHCIGNVSV